MEFFNSAVDVLQTLVIALGAGLAIWGVINHVLKGLPHVGRICLAAGCKLQGKLFTIIFIDYF